MIKIMITSYKTHPNNKTNKEIFVDNVRLIKC